MSVVVSGPRRVYVLLLFWQRLTERCATCPRSLSRIGDAIGVSEAQGAVPPCDALCRPVMRVGLRRVFWRRLIGLTFLILDATDVIRRR